MKVAFPTPYSKQKITSSRLFMSTDNALTLYLPDFSEQTLSNAGALTETKSVYDFKAIDDWEAHLCATLGDENWVIPWNLVRAQQFDLPTTVKTAVCCDPVMMQMSHRGAYLWGQNGIALSKKDAMTIVAQINQQLMRTGESFYMLNEMQWLYVSDEEKNLELASYEKNIGQDRFGFSYPGENGSFWDQLANEIQMLIKQMVDYQGLASAGPEMMLNVHFSGVTNASLSSPNIVANSNEFEVFSNNILINAFCTNNNISATSISLPEMKDIFSSANTHNKNRLLICYGESVPGIEKLDELIDTCLAEKNFEKVKLVVQNGIYRFSQKPSLLQKLASWLSLR